MAGANTVTITANGSRTLAFTPETLTANALTYASQANLLGSFWCGGVTHKALVTHDQNLTPW